MQFLTSPSSTPKYIDTYHIGNRFPLDVHCTVYNPYAHHGLISRCLIRFYLFSKSMCIYIYIQYTIYIYICITTFSLFSSRRQRVTAAALPPAQFCIRAYTMPCELQKSQYAWSRQQPCLIISFALMSTQCLVSRIRASMHGHGSSLASLSVLHVNKMPCEPHKSQHAWSRQQPFLLLISWAFMPQQGIVVMASSALCAARSQHKTYMLKKQDAQAQVFTNNTVRQQVTCNVAKA